MPLAMRFLRDFAREHAIAGALALACLSSPANAAIVGWQTFSNCGAHNDTGVCDTTPENNSTWDASPVGSISPASTYLSAAAGRPSSAAGRSGRGQQANASFLNGPGFGHEAPDPSRLVVNVPMADGTPGTRIGAIGSSLQGAPSGTSSWKFSTNDTARTGDFRVTNESDYYFVLDFLHFDARVGNANSPRRLEVRYLAGDGTAFDNALVVVATGTELANLTNLYDADLGAGPATTEISLDVLSALATPVFIAPGESAGFRFVWSDFRTSAAESQVDNLAFEGRFFATAALTIEIDPVGVPGVPVTYYVSATTGDDLRDGLSPSTAFATLDRVNSILLRPGDRVLFRSGEQWRGMFWPKGSGTASQPIEIGRYDGAEPPLLDGDGYQCSLLIVDDDHYVISGLALTNDADHLDSSGLPKVEPGFDGPANDNGSGENVRFGLKVVARSRSLTGFTLSDLLVRDVFPSPADVGHAHRGYGIKFESQSDVAAGGIHTISSVDMYELAVERTGHYGVWIRPLGLDGIDDHKHEHFTLRDSNFLDTGGSGFVAVKAADVLVEGNRFDRSGSHLDPRMWQRGSGLWTFDSRDVVIQYNEMRNARGPLDSYGVHIDYNNENVVVQFNYSYNNEGGFVQILGANANSGYRYNISVRDGSRIEGVDGALQNGRLINVSNFCNIAAGCPSTGSFIYNNTIWVPNTMSPEISFGAGSGETLFQNNLLVVEEGSSVLQTYMAEAGVSYTISNNLFYPSGRFALASPLAQSASFDNPNFVEAGADDPERYKILPDSPAKSLGVPIAAGTDFFGFPVAAGTAPHLGAYNGDEVFDSIAVPSLSWSIRVPALILLCFGPGFALRRNRHAL